MIKPGHVVRDYYDKSTFEVTYRLAYRKAVKPEDVEMLNDLGRAYRVQGLDAPLLRKNYLRMKSILESEDAAEAIATKHKQAMLVTIGACVVFVIVLLVLMWRINF